MSEPNRPADEHGAPQSEVVLYQTEDAQTRIQVRLEGGTAWLTQAQMADLFQTTPQNITQHLKALYVEGELIEEATCKHYLQVRSEGGREVRRELKAYNLDVILSVGYRVRSLRGTQFRQWATLRLKEYLVKGFALDDQRLKEAGGGDYFDELLARIRDIRSSEKLFYRKVLDIYATSVDYSPDAEVTQTFFKTVQNKMHWAAHGHTAAEVIAQRADSGAPNMGLTSWKEAANGGRIQRADVRVAKNYLNAEELDALNRIVTLYLDFAELQAMNRRPMSMHDWIAKLDDFLRLSERDILTHAGRISHERAMSKADEEFAKFKTLTAGEPTAVERHFAQAVEQVKKLAGKRTKAMGKSKRTPKGE
ncbi:MAG: virulence RhuM family protein [Gammaproteobacteria bacterium]|nr:virulence RhuM family protein [Gammaproteobacteria bacterium]